MLNICGCLIQTAPEKAQSVIAAITLINGCEVHAFDQGRIVTTVEDTSDKRASDLIMEMHQIPGVLSVTLTYHNFDQLGPERADAPVR